MVQFADTQAASRGRRALPPHLARVDRAKSDRARDAELHNLAEVPIVVTGIRRFELPVLRSAIDDIRQQIGTRLEGQAEFRTEDAWTRAAHVLARLAESINAVAPAGDPDYVAR